MKVLVTGAGGFAGRHLCRALRQQGHWVAGTVEGGLASNAPAQDSSRLDVSHNVSRIELDVRNADGCRSIVDSIRPDWIFHLAALTSVPASLNSPLETYRVNFLGTLNLLEAVQLLANYRGAEWRCTRGRDKRVERFVGLVCACRIGDSVGGACDRPSCSGKCFSRQASGWRDF